MRHKKTTATTIKLPDLDAAWRAFTTAKTCDDYQALRRHGWMTAADAAAITGMTQQSINRSLRFNEAFETQKVRLNLDGCPRVMNVYRPKQTV